ncbi:PEP-CTERM sorting domain-containing protein [Massilia sp. W12]|uniref:PEP-CTERM sorting domain-containing protein n=1 Tax=Massilia sp. W12 TaxID=3126507 RepID=UPI0030CEB742
MRRLFPFFMETKYCHNYSLLVSIGQRFLIFSLLFYGDSIHSCSEQMFCNKICYLLSCIKTIKESSLMNKLTHFAALALALSAGAAQAGTLNLPSGSLSEYIFNVSNNAGFPNQEMGRLSILQVGSDTKWTLSANWDNRLNSSNPFVFGLDYAMTSGRISQSNLSLFDVTGQVGLKSFGDRGVFFNPSNNANRFTDGEKVSWIFKNTNIANFLIKDLHVNAVYNGQSIKFTPTRPVPEAETWAMMLAGLAGFGLMRYRKQSKLA